MNERIRELASQCWEPRKWNPPWFDYEKFAKMLVRECISTIENAENGYQDYRNQIEDGMRNHCISLIKNEFGVEE